MRISIGNLSPSDNGTAPNREWTFVVEQTGLEIKLEFDEEGDCLIWLPKQQRDIAAALIERHVNEQSVVLTLWKQNVRFGPGEHSEEYYDDDGDDKEFAWEYGTPS